MVDRQGQRAAHATEQALSAQPERERERGKENRQELDAAKAGRGEERLGGSRHQQQNLNQYGMILKRACTVIDYEMYVSDEVRRLVTERLLSVYCTLS